MIPPEDPSRERSAARRSGTMDEQRIATKSEKRASLQNRRAHSQTSMRQGVFIGGFPLSTTKAIVETQPKYYRSLTSTVNRRRLFRATPGMLCLDGKPPITA